MLSHFKRALVLAPHTDDGELGAGGTIARLTEAGCQVHYAAFSIAEESVPNGFPSDILDTEVRTATRCLGILPESLHVFRYKVRKLSYARQDVLEELVRLRNAFNFDLVMMPNLHDIHQDHETVAREGRRAFKNITVLGYEEVHLVQKIEALQAYQSQRGRTYMSPEFVHSLATARGVQVGARYAEAFEVIRWVMR
jgi:LmbE family N-acetylglucosaminyl deacetylase